MLALRDTRAYRSSPRLQLLDLPNEILCEIVNCVFADGDRAIRSILPLSTTCHRFRKAAAPVLFRKIHVRLTSRCVDRRTFNILVGLILAPLTFACYVQHIVQHDEFRHREEGFEDLTLRNELVRGLASHAFRHMVSLKTITVGCTHSPVLGLAQTCLAQPLEIITEVCACEPRTEPGIIPIMQELCLTDTKHTFSISTSSRNRYLALYPWSVHATGKVSSLCWRDMPGHASFSSGQLRDVLHFRNLQELHLKSQEVEPSYFTTLADGLCEIRNLRRLSLFGVGLCSAVLAVVNQLISLEALRLNSTLDRIFHAHLHNHDFEGLPYLHLPRLKSLEIRYISRYLSIDHIVPKGLHHLKIEYHNRNERLASYDLRHIAKKSPDLECLEINCGPLTNLWHPTAIAGVDVDMDVYGVLDALSLFPSLRRLRLFPSYWQSRAGYLHFVQPLADEQAVRIYNHLRLKCRNLHELIISCSYLSLAAANGALSRNQSVPIKWNVRSSGSRTLLKTHEAGKGYHLDQIWEGDRRLTISNNRHRVRVPHFDELQNWKLPSYEFDFDEPQACQDQVMGSSTQ